MPRINQAKNFAGNKYATQNFVNSEILKLQNLVRIDGNGTMDGIGNAVASIVDITSVAEGQDTYKIKASVLPELAITTTYTHVIGDETSLDELIAAAIGDKEVQSGDVVILTSDDAAKANAYAGAYIFTAEATKANVTGKYTKIYVQEGKVVSVNGVAPVDGNVILDLEKDFGYKPYDDTLVVKSKVTGMTLNTEDKVIKVGVEGNILTVDTAEIAALRTQLGPSSDKKTSNVYARLDIIEASLGLGGDGGDDGIAELLAKEIANRKAGDAALLAGLNAEITARKADDVVLETAINAEIANRKSEDALLETAINSEIANRKSEDAILASAINTEIDNRAAQDALLQGAINGEIANRKAEDEVLAGAINAEIAERKANDAALKSAIETSVKIDTETMTVSTTAENTVFSQTMANAGIVFAVVDKENNQVYPTIIYTSGKATLSADYEGEATDTWTVYYASNPAVTIASAAQDAALTKVGADLALTEVGTDAALVAGGDNAALTKAGDNAALANKEVPAQVTLPADK